MNFNFWVWLKLMIIVFNTKLFRVPSVSGFRQRPDIYGPQYVICVIQWLNRHLRFSIYSNLYSHLFLVTEVQPFTGVLRVTSLNEFVQLIYNSLNSFDQYNLVLHGMCFLVNFAKFFRTFFLDNLCWNSFLRSYISKYVQKILIYAKFEFKITFQLTIWGNQLTKTKKPKPMRQTQKLNQTQLPFEEKTSNLERDIGLLKKLSNNSRTFCNHFKIFYSSSPHLP